MGVGGLADYISTYYPSVVRFQQQQQHGVGVGGGRPRYDHLAAGSSYMSVGQLRNKLGGRHSNNTRGAETTHLFMDMNSIIHTIFRRNPNTDTSKIYKQINMRIKQTVDEHFPVKTLFLTTDGPGPRAKIPLQRKRRSKSKEDGISSSLITPGTMFMSGLKDSLANYFKHSRSVSSAIISASDRYGEGEFKIFEYINSKTWTDQDSVIVFSDDSDVILCSMLSSAPNIIVKGTSSTKCYHIADLKQQLIASAPLINPKQLIEDFVFLNLFRGSDYYPRMDGFNFVRSWTAYLEEKSKKGLYNPKTRSINKELLQKIFNIGEGAVGGGGDSVNSLRQLSWNTSLKNYIAMTWSHLGFKFGKNNIISNNNKNNKEGTTSTTTTTTEPSIVEEIESKLLRPTFSKEGNGQYYMTLDGIKHGPFKVDAKYENVDGWADLSPIVSRAILTEPDNIFLNYYQPQLSAEKYQILKSKRTSFAMEIEDQENASPPDVGQYMQCVIWLMELLKGKCTNFHHRYLPKYSPSINHFSSLSKLNNKELDRFALPLTPLECNIALTHQKTIHNVHPIFHSIINHSNHFSLIDYIAEQAWNDEESVNNLLKQINETDTSLLNEKEKRLMTFSPTVIYTKSGNQIYYQEEKLANETNKIPHIYSERKPYIEDIIPPVEEEELPDPLNQQSSAFEPSTAEPFKTFNSFKESQDKLSNLIKSNANHRKTTMLNNFNKNNNNQNNQNINNDTFNINININEN
ncbi:hypothetical protein DFA_04210 [Cavenderia fasciculata]|uniref:Xrn1 N-terminal domain-containing protein n=1 Tax=Cavenderia fasciculata TaxID=261658 RepID=F4Q1L3_CACFS|nr:uncharacterized protein DFA_04210 [Cavenderia fasciculata]EGG18714.1 hypothetical protein DFA_04210 [Cavenderia fasciculata]|eukprot:XP_004366618.1 hypothetical protein DFA_04210 [Cavenderia fasciculata]